MAFRFRRAWLTALVFFLAGGVLAAPVDEAQVKAAFVFNVMRYVEWPDGALPPGAPLVVCRVGSEPLARALSLLEGRQVGGREIRLRQVDGDAAGCHALVLPEGAGRSLLAKVLGRPILTVGEGWDFLEESGMVAMVVMDGKLAFGANLEAARRSNLRLSAQLLKLARRVVEGAGK